MMSRCRDWNYFSIHSPAWSPESRPCLGPALGIQRGCNREIPGGSSGTVPSAIHRRNRDRCFFGYSVNPSAGAWTRNCSSTGWERLKILTVMCFSGRCSSLAANCPEAIEERLEKVAEREHEAMYGDWLAYDVLDRGAHKSSEELLKNAIREQCIDRTASVHGAHCRAS